jgi:hypothetical protein
LIKKKRKLPYEGCRLYKKGASADGTWKQNYEVYKIVPCEVSAWWERYSGKAWRYGQCTTIRSVTKALPDCKIACEHEVKCNIINVKGFQCYMGACPTPIPEPRANQGIYVGFTGYKLIRDKLPTTETQSATTKPTISTTGIPAHRTSSSVHPTSIPNAKMYVTSKYGASNCPQNSIPITNKDACVVAAKIVKNNPLEYKLLIINIYRLIALN